MNIGLHFAGSEALRVILDHEGVPYTRGIGAGNSSVVIIAQSDVQDYNRAIDQWKTAMSAIAQESDRALESVNFPRKPEPQMIPIHYTRETT